MMTLLRSKSKVWLTKGRKAAWKQVKRSTSLSQMMLTVAMIVLVLAGFDLLRDLVQAGLNALEGVALNFPGNLAGAFTTPVDQSIWVTRILALLLVAASGFLAYRALRWLSRTDEL
jgi:hypothetical protein